MIDNLYMVKDTTRMVLARNLAALMAKNKHSQGYVHKRTGVSQSTVGRILNCDVAATSDTLDAIAKLYDVFAWQLIVPELDVYNPQMLKTASQKEMEFYERIKQAAQDLAKYENK